MMRVLPTLARVAALVTLASPALALSGALAVDPARSNVQIQLENLFAAGTKPLSISGTLAVELSLDSDPTHGPYVSSLAAVGSLAIDDVTLTISSPGLTDATAEALGVAGGVALDPLIGAPTGPGTSVFARPLGAAILDQGTFSMSGSVVQLPLDLLVDFSALNTPVSTANLTVVAQGLPDGRIAVDLIVPIDFVFGLTVNGFENVVTLSGDLVWTGTAVPEPATALLVAVGIACAGACSRRRPG